MKFISDKAKALSIMGWAQHHKEDDHVVVGKVQGQKKAIDELLPEIKNGGPPVARNMSAFEVSLVAGEAGFECRV
jgi:acylphosphatase